MQSTNYRSLTLQELRQQWADSWGIEPHRYIGRKMLETSLELKQYQHQNPILYDQKMKQLYKIINSYKRNRNHFKNPIPELSSGAKLIRIWKGEKHIVTVLKDGFEYNQTRFSSLSAIANHITGSRWNGNVFFGLK